MSAGDEERARERGLDHASLAQLLTPVIDHLNHDAFDLAVERWLDATTLLDRAMASGEITPHDAAVRGGALHVALQSHVGVATACRVLVAEHDLRVARGEAPSVYRDQMVEQLRLLPSA